MSSNKKSESKNKDQSTKSTSSGFVWQRDTWKVAEKFFEQPKILAHNQINSYNDFIDNIIPSLIKNHNPIVIGNDYDPETERFRNRYEVEFYGQPYMSRPQINEGSGSIRQLFPNEARLRNLSYSAYMHLDVTHRYYENDVMIKEKTETQIPFKLPCMTHSKYCYLDANDSESRKLMGECPYDQGGYFIINGSEKVIISQERPVDNKVLCFKQKEGSKFDESVEIRSTIDQRFYPVRNNWVSLTHPKEGEPNQFLRVYFPCLSNTNPVPLSVVFRAMGITTDKEICQMILEMPLARAKDDFMQLIIPSFEETHEVITEVTEQDASGRTKKVMKKARIKITTQDQALNFIAKHIANMNLDYLEQKLPARLNEQERVEAREIAKKEYVLDILRRDLLPHVGSDFRRKALFLGHMANVLIRCKLGMREYDVRDHYANKRLDLAGVKLKQLFQGSFGRLIKEIKKEVTRIMEDSSKGHLHPGLRKVIQNCNIDAPMKKALSTGDWNATKSANLFSSTNLGIAQLLQRQSYINYVSNIRRIQTPMERAGGKITEPRKLDPTQYGYVCPNETPEGQQVGIVKNLALTCTITISSSTLPVKTALKSKKMQITPIDNMEPEQIYFQTKVFLNGEWIGCTRDARKVHQMVKRFKRDGTFSPYLGVYWDFDNREISIRSDGGRYTRPIYTVQRTEDNKWIPKIQAEWEEAKKMNWIDLVRHGYIEYVDPEECENAMIAITNDSLLQNDVKKPEFFDYTHLEIHPSLNQGVVSQMIPFSDHNQGIRNLYQCLWKETKILMADNTYKPIKDVKIGDQVISVNPDTLEQKPATVINQYVKPTEKPIVKITNQDGSTLICTEDHPILTSNGWKKASDLLKYDMVRHRDQETNSIKNQLVTVEPYQNVEIADITVDNDWHSFIVESGIVVHNSSMGKQALGLHATNYNHRMDTFANVLCYPQKPLVQTRTAKFVNLDRLPHGQQCIVAVASYTGYNQEDSVLFNKAAVERGKFNSLYFKTYVSEMNPHKSSNAEEEKFGKPDPERTQGMKHGENPYEHLDDDGFVKVGSYVKANDVIIGKVVKLKDEVKSVTGRRITHNDISIQVKPGEDGYVDARIPSPGSVKNFNSDNNPFCKVRTCQYRRPVIGDKLASRHAQKGTIGLILPEEDMPFTDSGLVPDIIMNPHALPSRMTVGQMLECIFGKAACLEAEVQDATPWTDFDRENIGDILEKYGFERDGEEVMYNGFTGEMLKTTIFIGPVYYQRLKHMVQDKIHARATGRVNNLTKQSVEGRNQGGGLRSTRPLSQIKLGQVSAQLATSSKSGNVLKGLSTKQVLKHICGFGENSKVWSQPQIYRIILSQAA